jgi:hypothetical protein
MSALRTIWIWILLFIFSVGFAQGDANLLLQYNRGADLDGFYRKWNVDLHTHLVYGNTREDYSLYKIRYSAGTYLQYKFSKTFALNSGVDYFNLSYQYNLRNNQSYDRLAYLSIPLTLRVFPSRKLFFEMGLLFNRLLQAKNTEIVDLRNQSKLYPEGVFKNTFGWLFATQYNVWKRFDVSIQYRFFKKPTNPLSNQKNNFKAFMLGVHFFVLNPKKKPK